MKGKIAATALAALTGAASAHNHRRAHELFKKNLHTGEVCVPGCTTYWTTITGEPTLVSPPPPKTTIITTPEVVTTPEITTTKTTTATLTSTSTAVVTKPPVTSTSQVVVVPLPTPQPITCPTPGTYTIPATTVTVTDTTVICGASSTSVPPGTHTVGGVTTVIVTPTTVTCPVATVSTSGTVTTSTVVQTTYVCPTAGTYTINPITTTVTESTVVVYPVPSTCLPGTYTAPEQTITVTKTGYVTYCPFTSSGLPTTTKAPVNTAPPPPPPAPKPTTEIVVSIPPVVIAPPPIIKPTTEEAPKPQPTTVVPQPPKSSSPPKSSPPSSPSAPLGGSSDHWGITYTPYESSNGNCKSADQVDADIAKLKSAGFTVVRVYSTDCNTLVNVGNACEKHGLELIIGVFVKGSGCSYNSPDIKEQVDAIAQWSKWGLVRLIVVGNEAVMNGFCSPQELRDLIVVVKEKCSGYTGHYTISETLNIWQRSDVSGAICDVVDVVGANIHPFFNPTVTPSGAGDFVNGQLQLLGKICANHQPINLECGWPTAGTCNGVACPGVDEQKTALESIRQKAGGDTIFFSYENDEWKSPGAFGCEKSWGSAQAFGM